MSSTEPSPLPADGSGPWPREFHSTAWSIGHSLALFALIGSPCALLGGMFFFVLPDSWVGVTVFVFALLVGFAIPAAMLYCGTRGFIVCEAGGFTAVTGSRYAGATVTEYLWVEVTAVACHQSSWGDECTAFLNGL